MSPSVTARAMQTVSKAVAVSGLKDAGFRRQGNHLHRAVGRLFHAVHFQASKWSSASSGSFTIDLVVTSPFLFTSWTGNPLPSNPASALWPVVARIGSQMPARRDHWWDVDERTNVEDLAREVARVVVEYGLPFFDAFGSTETMLRCLRDGTGLPGLTESQLALVHAMLATEAGARSEAHDVLRRAYLAAAGSPFQGTVRLIANRLQVQLDPDAPTRAD